jgi:hypothetical protein
MTTGVEQGLCAVGCVVEGRWMVDHDFIKKFPRVVRSAGSIGGVDTFSSICHRSGLQRRHTLDGYVGFFGYDCGVFVKFDDSARGCCRCIISN